MKTKFNDFLNENNNYPVRNIEREKQIYPKIFEPDLKSVKEYEYDKIMKELETDKEKYDLIWDIMEYMNIYNKKVGINKGIKLSNIKSIMYKSNYNLKQIKHKWMKLSENPDIEPQKIFNDFINESNNNEYEFEYVTFDKRNLVMSDIFEKIYDFNLLKKGDKILIPNPRDKQDRMIYDVNTGNYIIFTIKKVFNDNITVEETGGSRMPDYVYRIKDLNRNINESYNITQDDYNYFRGFIEDNGNDKKWVESIKQKRSDWVKMMLASAKSHWSIGDGKPEEFPREQFLKVINNVLDEYINESK